MTTAAAGGKDGVRGNKVRQGPGDKGDRAAASSKLADGRACERESAKAREKARARCDKKGTERGIHARHNHEGKIEEEGAAVRDLLCRYKTSLLPYLIWGTRLHKLKNAGVVPR
jgi:hypothetical protein